MDQIVYIVLFPIILVWKYCKAESKKNRGLLLSLNITGSLVLYNSFLFLFFTRDMLNVVLDEFVEAIICIAVILFTYIISKRLLDWYKQRDKWLIYRTFSYLSCLLFLLTLLYFLWLLSVSGRLSFDIVMYNLQTSINNESDLFATQAFPLLSEAIIIIVSCTYIFYFSDMFQAIKWKKRKDIPCRKRRMAGLVLVLLLLLSACFPIYAFHLEDAYEYFYVSDSFVEENYIDPLEANLSWPSKKQNLIYIFVESFESSFFSKELGGIDDDNLLKNLTPLMEEGITFSDGEQYGGYTKMPSTGWTIAGMTTLLGGVNYRIPSEYNESDPANLMPGLTTLNDLLKSQGYQEHFIIGTGASNYNIGPFFQEHGDAKIEDYYSKVEDGHIPSDYKVWWGFEDKKLFDFAKETLTEISAKEEPFLYTLTTNDTHPVNGYTDKSCPTEYDIPLKNAIVCEDQMLGEFLTWVKEQSFYDDTTIVIVGDHRSHDDVYFSQFDRDANRKSFNLILNSKVSTSDNRYYNRNFWAADMFPTVLASLGVEIPGDRLGLGVNLFSNTPTLLEDKGELALSSALSRKSEFYDKEFLKETNEK